jgi:hypothetical protein
MKLFKQWMTNILRLFRICKGKTAELITSYLRRRRTIRGNWRQLERWSRSISSS